MELFLKRFLFTDDGVAGVLTTGNRVICYTLEREWKNNASGLSCIPEGTYLCQKVDTPKHGVTYEVTKVLNRTAILFHSGNTEVDSLGCILLGLDYGEMDAPDPTSGVVEKQLALLESRLAFKRFMGWLNDAPSFTLTIKNC